MRELIDCFFQCFIFRDGLKYFDIGNGNPTSRSVLVTKLVNEMSSLVKKVIIFVFLFGVADTLCAKCHRPEVPALPDGETAVLAQMVKAKKEVSKYMTSAKAYLACASNSRQHDKVVDKMRTIAKDYNDLAKAYKKRVKA